MCVEGYTYIWYDEVYFRDWEVWFAVVDRTLHVSISLRPRGKINNNQVDYN